MPADALYTPVELHPDPGHGETLTLAVATSYRDPLSEWLSGEVHARGIQPAWSPMLQWLTDRTGLTYRDPIAPATGGPPAPTTGQGWPR